jgi:Fe2+ or Zn2+ uptake regulation protein
MSSRKLLLKGKRFTRQRQILWDLIQSSTGHLDAKELFLKAQAQGLDISLATIYRNLELFKELGYLEKRWFNENHRHFEVSRGRKHFHLICTVCGRVQEFKSKSLQALEKEVEEKTGLNIVESQLNFYGLCQECQKKVKRT